MQSIIKRNRNSISRVQSKLLSVFKTMNIVQPNNSFIHTRITVPDSIAHTDRSWDRLTLFFRIGVPNAKFIPIEVDGKLLIGLSLSESTITLRCSTGDLVRSFNSALDEPGYSRPSEFSKIIHKELGITSDNWKGKWNHEYDNLYPSTSIYKDVTKWADKIQSNFTIELKKGEYPFSPRDFLPIFVFDSESLEGWYINDSDGYDLSYRKNHLPTGLSYCSDHVVVALRNIPLKLCQIKSGGSTYDID